MNIYPAIDILNGNAVRLRQGVAKDATVYGQPIDMAKRWVTGGAEWLHVVDLQGAFEGAPRNHHLVEQIAKVFPKLKIQLGGGVRNIDTVERLLEVGIARVVLGTSVVTDLEFVSEALRRYPGRIAIGIDARDGFAKVAGWTADSKIGAIELAQKLEALGAQIVIYTDISRDGVLQGPNIPAVLHMIESTGLNVIASGGVSNLEDIRSLGQLKQSRLEGVIVGKALYEGLIKIEEALAIAS